MLVKRKIGIWILVLGYSFCSVLDKLNI